MAVEVNPGVVSVQEFERQPVPYKKEELKVSSNKTVSIIKSSTFKVLDINHLVEEEGLKPVKMTPPQDFQIFQAVRVQPIPSLQEIEGKHEPQSLNIY
jgi:hypothetical protein